MTQEIKPCPVCGGEAGTTYCNFFAYCSDKKCMLFGVEIPADRWNSRPESMGEALRGMKEKLDATYIGITLKHEGSTTRWCAWYDINPERCDPDDFKEYYADTPEEAVRKAREGMED